MEIRKHCAFTNLVAKVAWLSVVLISRAMWLVPLCGCGGDPYAHRYCSRRPDVRNLVGTWSNREGTADLVVKADGTAIGSGDILQFEESLDKANARLKRRATGSWRLERQQGWWVLWVDWKATPNALDIYSGSLKILGNSPPYSLHRILGDPDLGEVVALVKNAVTTEASDSP